MRLGLYLLLLTTFTVNANGFSQKAKVTLDVKQGTLLHIITELRKAFDYQFLYRVDDLEKYGRRDLKVQDAGVEEVMNKLLLGTYLTWRLEDDVILIKAADTVQQRKMYDIKGQVFDDKKNPLPGVTVRMAGTMVGTAGNV